MISTRYQPSVIGESEGRNIDVWRDTCRFHDLFSFCPRGSHSLAKMPRVSRKESRPVSQRQRASLAKITCEFGKGEAAVYSQNRKSPCGEENERLRNKVEVDSGGSSSAFELERGIYSIPPSHRHADAHGGCVVRPSPSGVTGLALGWRRAGPTRVQWLGLSRGNGPSLSRGNGPGPSEPKGWAWHGLSVLALFVSPLGSLNTPGGAMVIFCAADGAFRSVRLV